MAPALHFLADHHAGHFVGVGFDVRDGELADVTLGEEVTRLGDGGDETGAELAEAVDIRGDLSAGDFGVAGDEAGTGTLHRVGAFHFGFGGDLLPGGPDELIEAAGEGDEFAHEVEETGGVEVVAVGELELGFEDFDGLGGPIGTGAFFRKSRIGETLDGGFTLFFGEGGGELDKTGDEKGEIVEFLGVGSGLGIGLLAGAGDIDLTIPGGEAFLEFREKWSALVGEEFGQSVLDFVGEIILTDVGGLVGEIDLDQAQTVHRRGDKPGEVGHLFRQDEPPSGFTLFSVHVELGRIICSVP